MVGSVATTGDEATGFSITAGDTGGAFAIDNSGQITVADATQLDFETTNTYTMTIEATDGTSVDSEDVTANVTDSATAVVDAYNRLLTADRGPEQVRFDLGVAWRIYRRLAGEGNANAFGFIQHCETEPGNEQVLADLDALQELFTNMKTLGLTDSELQVPMDSAIGLFASPDLPVRTLEAILDALGSEQTAINLP